MSVFRHHHLGEGRATDEELDAPTLNPHLGIYRQMNFQRLYSFPTLGNHSYCKKKTWFA